METSVIESIVLSGGRFQKDLIVWKLPCHYYDAKEIVTGFRRT